MKITGSCHCGAIAFEAEVDAERVSICHCSDCQKLTGSAYRVSVACERDDFILLRGTPATYIKRGDSGALRVQSFCANCGSPLFVHGVEDPSRLGLRVGCIDQRKEFVPRRQIWCRSSLPWTMDLRDLPRRERE